MEKAGDVGRGHKQARPAVPIQGTGRGLLEEVTREVPRNCQLLNQFGTIERETPVKQISHG